MEQDSYQMEVVGDSHTMALTSTGAVWGWGCFRGDSGAFGFSPSLDFALTPTLVYSPASPAEQVLSIASGKSSTLLNCNRRLTESPLSSTT